MTIFEVQLLREENSLALAVEKLSAEIEYLQQQIDRLRAELESALRRNHAPAVAELYGILGGTLNISEEDLEAVRIHVDWEKLLPSE